MIEQKSSQILAERQRNALWLLAGLLLSAALLYVADWEADRQERVRLDAFRGDVADLAQVSETIIADRLHEHDNSLLVLRDSYTADPKGVAEKVRLLRSGPLADREILVVLVDRKGNLTYTDTPNVKPGLYRGDASYFKYFAGGGKDIFYISAPVFGRVTKRYSIPLVRPIYDKQGVFSGVVALSVRQDSLANFGPRLQLSGDATVTVVTRDGEVAGRSRDLEKFQGTKINQKLLTPMLTGKEGIFSSHAASPDGIERVIAYRHIPDTPLIVYVETSPGDVLREISLQRMILLWGAGFISLAIMVLIAVYLKGRKTTLQLIDTERILADRELQQSRQQYRNLIEGTPDLITRVDLEGYFLFVNHTAQEIFGLSPEECIGRKAFDFIHPDDKEATSAAFNAWIQSGAEIFTLENRLVGVDGQRHHHMLWTIRAERDENGKVSGFASTGRDITESKHAQEENVRLESQLQHAQKMESIGRLAGGVAHDFNNMLTVILGHAQMGLMRLDPGHPVCADLTVISQTAERSADLTRQLLAFARKQTIAPRVLELNETITAMLMMLQRLIGEQIHLTWQPAPDLWQVRMDPSQIDQILANLCVNARDAIADTGHISIETENSTIDAAYCAANPEALPGEYVRLSVSDDGTGMDKETVLHIFEPFYTTKELGKGTGLGLATVYGSVKQNNGFITIYSEPGQGTTFSIYLPRYQGKSILTSPPKTDAPELFGHETILLVEDEPSILNITSQMLEKQGYTVLKAVTPGEAMQLAREHGGGIHLLMTDVIMPEMNGRDLAKNLLSIYPGMKQLFMSGYTADVIAHHGVLDDGVLFIQKPFSLLNMAAMVREVLDKP